MLGRVARGVARNMPLHCASASSSPLSSMFSCAPRFISVRFSSFSLSKSFVDTYRDVPPLFGFNGLGELVYRRTYARQKEDGKSENWVDTIERVVNGTMSMQLRWMKQSGLPWDEEEAEKTGREMFDRMFNMKFLPPGRGLWAMGSPITEERKTFAALNNCAFVSTQNLATDRSQPFAFLMDAAMLGVGVGFDTKGAGTTFVPGALDRSYKHVIKDSREGWVESVVRLLDCHLDHTARPEFDYSRVRPAGMAIRGFGGVSSGPAPLKDLHVAIENVMRREKNGMFSVTGIVDLMNLIGRCVVSGNVRRTAEISFGDPMLPEYIDLKDYSKNPSRADFGWTSNNSVFASLGMDYSDVCKRVQVNGEPGFAWLDNMRRYGRMGDPPNNKDIRAMGGNPCLEQTLESYELCCLVETFPHRHDSLEDFLTTLKYAFLYAKTVTLGPTHWPETNKVMMRNRRIGTSMSGIAQFVAARGLEELREWCEQGYQEIQKCDELYSEMLCVPRSIKTTSIKPSGTVSLLAGATPGIHFPESRFYIRRVRIANTSPLLEALVAANYPVEPAVSDSQSMVVSIPVDVGAGVPTLGHVTMWEQLSLAAFLQRHWADNQVSCTVTFDPASEGQHLARALNYFQYNLKGISFLPRLPQGAFAQMPYEAINEETFAKMASALKPLQWSPDTRTPVFSDPAHTNITQPPPDNFCDSSSCEIVR
eukprot:c5423_g1_i1.p1 GENE.c5423_g1_i1~~c5423_g1_i1.p1  ORF type:complete len:706 (-),score=169.12 c5423_g1_i1:64-2181(-)